MPVSSLPTLVVMDGPNFFNACRRLGVTVDYARFKLMIEEMYNPLLRIVYCTPLSDAPNSKLQPLIRWMECNGYTTLTRPLRTDADYTSIAVDVTTVALTQSDNCGRVALFTGSSEYIGLVEELKARGIAVDIWSTCATNPRTVHEDMMHLSDRFFDLNNYSTHFQRAEVQPIKNRPDSRPVGLGVARV